MTTDTMTATTDLVRDYRETWNETDPATRQRRIAESWTEDATYTDPMFEVCGHDGIEAMIAGFRSQFPLVTFRQLDAPEAYHDRLRFR